MQVSAVHGAQLSRVISVGFIIPSTIYIFFFQHDPLCSITHFMAFNLNVVVMFLPDTKEWLTPISSRRYFHVLYLHLTTYNT
ncbi:hypothetical protein FKM82_021248 [Ascaphus truei]